MWLPQAREVIWLFNMSSFLLIFPDNCYSFFITLRAFLGEAVELIKSTGGDRGVGLNNPHSGHNTKCLIEQMWCERAAAASSYSMPLFLFWSTNILVHTGGRIFSILIVKLGNRIQRLHSEKKNKNKTKKPHFILKQETFSEQGLNPTLWSCELLDQEIKPTQRLIFFFSPTQIATFQRDNLKNTHWIFPLWLSHTVTITCRA